MNSGRHERCKTVTQTPPAKSRLATYVAYLDELGKDGAPLWTHSDKDLRLLGVAAALQDEPRLCKLPFDLVRNELLVPALHDMGMPSGQRPPWLEAVLDDATNYVRLSDSLRSSKTSRGTGHPKAKVLPAMVFYAVYLDVVVSERGRTDNLHFEAVARRLGPGINRNHVRRVIKSYRRFLGRSDTGIRHLALSAALRVSDLLLECDAAHPPKKRARNQAQTARC